MVALVSGMLCSGVTYMSMAQHGLTPSGEDAAGFIGGVPTLVHSTVWERTKVAVCACMYVRCACSADRPRTPVPQKDQDASLKSLLSASCLLFPAIAAVCMVCRRTTLQQSDWVFKQ